MIKNNQYALITGATSGIGFELAKLFAKDGYNLVIVARDEAELTQTAQELEKDNLTVVKIATDLFDTNNALELYKNVKSQGIDINVLVNNAGQGVYGKFMENDLNRELDIIQLNIASLVVLTKTFGNDMVARGEGKILNVASIAGKTPGPFQAVYHGTKAFVHSFNEAIRNELKDTGVSVTSLLPGATDTGFFEKADMLDSKAVVEGSLADPADVAKDGYDALMAGKDMVISGWKNKVQMAMANLTPDETIAKQVHHQQAPIDETK